MNATTAAAPPPTIEDQLDAPPSRRAVIAIVGLVLLVALLATATAVLWPQVWQRDREQARDEALLGAARQTVSDLLTVDQVNPQASLDRLRREATGEFTQQVVSESDIFIQAVTGSKVSSTGSISAAGIRTATDDEASVLVTAASMVHNSQAPGGQPRQYRILLELRHEGPAWLVSKLDFLP